MEPCHAGLYLANLRALLMDKGDRERCKGRVTAITACLQLARVCHGTVGVKGKTRSQDEHVRGKMLKDMYFIRTMTFKSKVV